MLLAGIGFINNSSPQAKLILYLLFYISDLLADNKAYQPYQIHPYLLFCLFRYFTTW